jgi:hypothetical protein
MKRVFIRAMGQQVLLPQTIRGQVMQIQAAEMLILMIPRGLLFQCLRPARVQAITLTRASVHRLRLALIKMQ